MPFWNEHAHQRNISGGSIRNLSRASVWYGWYLAEVSSRQWDMSTRLRVEMEVRNTNLRAISMVDNILVIWLEAIPPRIKYSLKKRQLRNEAWSTPKFRGWREVNDPTKEETGCAKMQEENYIMYVPESQGNTVFLKRARHQKCSVTMLGLVGQGLRSDQEILLWWSDGLRFWLAFKWLQDRMERE